MEDRNQNNVPYPGSTQNYPYNEGGKTSGFAIASLVFGIISLFGGAFVIIPPLLAVIFGHIGISACRKDPRTDGKGLAIAGLVMGYLCIAGWLVYVLFVIGLFALAASASASGY